MYKCSIHAGPHRKVSTVFSVVSLDSTSWKCLLDHSRSIMSLKVSRSDSSQLPGPHQKVCSSPQILAPAAVLGSAVAEPQSLNLLAWNCNHPPLQPILFFLLLPPLPLPLPLPPYCCCCCSYSCSYSYSDCYNNYYYYDYCCNC